MIKNLKLDETFDTRFDDFSIKMDHLIATKQLPCISTLIFHDDHIVDYRVHGYRNSDLQTPLQPNDIFRIASMTKPIVSVGVLMLIEEGKLHLDDKLSSFLPNAKNLKVFHSQGPSGPVLDDLEREITVLDLLTHTSGFLYPSQPSNPIDQRYNDILKCKLLTYDPVRDNMTLEEFVNHGTNVYLYRQPGKEFVYGISTDFLGFIIECVSGQKLDVFLKERIFSKLEMVDTDFYVHDEKLPRLVSIHIQNENKLFFAPESDLQRLFRDKVTFLYPTGGLTSSMSDYLNFTLMLMNKGKFNGKQIIKPETFDLFITDFISLRGSSFSYQGGWRIANKEFLEQWLTAIDPHGRDIGFCLGVKKKVSSQYYKNGIFGWGGTFGTNFFFDPYNKITCLLLTQILPNPANFIYFQLFSDLEDLTYRTLSV